MIEALLKEQPDIPGFLLEEHGLVTIATQAEDAENNAELFEENARVFLGM